MTETTPTIDEKALAETLARAKDFIAYPNVHFHYKDGVEVMQALVDAVSALSALGAEPVAGDDDDRTLAAACRKYNIGSVARLDETIAALRSHTHPSPAISDEAVGRDYFASLVARARTSAAKAAIKFPQPNYVTLKIAEEAGEVVRGAVHYAENRMEWSEVEGEIVQLLAMLIRFVTEGDQINGVTPPAALEAGKV